MTMTTFFDTKIRPISKSLDKKLRIKHITVQVVPSELEAKYKYIRYNPLTQKTTYGFQFDPLGYESRIR